jgi:hypothetical protein
MPRWLYTNHRHKMTYVNMAVGMMTRSHGGWQSRYGRYCKTTMFSSCLGTGISKPFCVFWPGSPSRVSRFRYSAITPPLYPLAA